MRHLVPLAAAALVGCSSSSTPTACIEDGTYSMAETRTGGTCGALPSDSSGAPATVTIQTTNGQTELIFQGLTGGCPVRVNGCKLDAACTISASGQTVGTGQLSLTSNGAGTMQGTDSDAITQKLDTVPGSPCTVDYKTTLTRK